MHLNLNAFLARRPLRIGSPSLSSPPLISPRSPSFSLRTSVSSTHTSILINHPTHLPQPSQPLISTTSSPPPLLPAFYRIPLANSLLPLSNSYISPTRAPTILSPLHNLHSLSFTFPIFTLSSHFPI